MFDSILFLALHSIIVLKPERLRDALPHLSLRTYVYTPLVQLPIPKSRSIAWRLGEILQAVQSEGERSSVSALIEEAGSLLGSSVTVQQLLSIRDIVSDFEVCQIRATLP